jgi:large conductance mechanosensitive channel
MSIMKEFREFAVKGNALEMAVGVIIGAEFGKIVSSLVSDIIMPPIGQLIGGVKFSGLFLSLNGVAYKTLEEAKAAGAATLNYGSFIDSVVKFVIIAFSVFMIVRTINKLRTEEKASV